MCYRFYLSLSLAAIFLLCSDCGKKSDDAGAGGPSFVPSDWDGANDYPNTRWEFLSP